MNKESSLSPTEDSRSLDMITVAVPIGRSIAASDWFVEHDFTLTDPKLGEAEVVSPGCACVGWLQFKDGLPTDVLFRFHSADSSHALMFKLSWGGK